MGGEKRRERLLVHPRTLHRCLRSPVNKETEKLANVGNHCLSCQQKKKTNGSVVRGGGRERECPVGDFDHSAEHGPDLMASTFTHDGVWQ